MTARIAVAVAMALLAASCGTSENVSRADPPAPSGTDLNAPCSCGAAGDARSCTADLRCCCGPTSPNIASGGAGWCAARCPEINPAAGGAVASGDSEHEHHHGSAEVSTPGPCQADASHCCLDDGTLVRPGGCQPHYPGGVQPATVRGADGRCEPVPCMLRCLPATARIATPSGDVAVSALHAGDRVFTADGSGARIVARVRVVQRVPIVGAHDIVELTLADGRVVRASAGHPTASGALVGELATSAVLDGSIVVSTRHVSYDGRATWDLLPAGPTGAYWADGVLLGSTLRAP